MYGKKPYGKKVYRSRRTYGKSSFKAGYYAGLKAGKYRSRSGKYFKKKW